MADPATVEIDDDTVVEVDIDAGADIEGTVAKPTNGDAAAATAATTAADEAAAALKKSLEESKKRENAALATADAERRRAQDAEARATAKDREVVAARESATNSQLVIITNRIDTANGALEAAKAEHRTAHEAGDIDKITDALAKIGSATAQIERFTGEKEAFEAQAAARAEQQETEAARVPDRSVEAYIGRGRSTAAAAFLRAHPDCLPADYGGTPKKNALMMAGHNMAMAQSIKVDTPEYFEVVESYINGGPVSAAAATTAAGDEAAAATAQRQQQRKTPVPSAPPSRDPPAADGSPTGKQTVRLNGQQQEMALLSFPQKPGEDDSTWRKRAFGTYANNYAAAKREGIIGRLTH